MIPSSSVSALRSAIYQNLASDFSVSGDQILWTTVKCEIIKEMVSVLGNVQMRKKKGR